MDQFRNFYCGNRSAERGGQVATVRPVRGRRGLEAGRLSLQITGLGNMPIAKTGDVIFLPHLHDEYRESCFENNRLVVIGAYDGDDRNGNARITWRKEITGYSILKLQHKPISILDPEFWKLLEQLPISDAEQKA